MRLEGLGQAVATLPKTLSQSLLWEVTTGHGLTAKLLFQGYSREGSAHL